MCHQASCGCESHAHIPGGVTYHHEGCCCDHGHSPRHFPSREELINEMEDYLKQLRAEAKGVEERLTEMKKEG